MNTAGAHKELESERKADDHPMRGGKNMNGGLNDLNGAELKNSSGIPWAQIEMNRLSGPGWVA